MKYFLSILSFLFVSIVVSAQTQNGSKALLDKTYATFESSGGIRLSFQSAMTGKDGTAYAPQSGEACIKGDKFKLEMESMDIWFDGKTQWVLLKDVNEVNISAPTGSEIAAISPLALLGIYKNGVTLKAPVSKTIRGRSAHVIDMIPVNANKDFKSAAIAIDKESGQVLQVILLMPDGMKNTIDISACNTNHQFNDAMFRFDMNDHPGVEIVDLR